MAAQVSAATDYILATDLDTNRPSQIAMLSEMSEQTWATYTLNDEAATPLADGPVLWKHESAMKRLAAKGDALTQSILFTQPASLSDVLTLLVYMSNEQDVCDPSAEGKLASTLAVKFATESVITFLARNVPVSLGAYGMSSVNYAVERTALRTLDGKGGAA